MKHFTRFLVFFTLATACEGDEGVIKNLDSGYFPLEKGLYHVYTIHEIRYTASAEPLVLDYEIVAEVVDSFPSAENEYTYVIHRSRRSTETDPWEPLDTWSVRKNKREVVVSEGTTSFVRITFPLTAASRWDGNALNTLGRDEYALVDIHQPMEISGMNFEKTVTVEQERNEDPIVFRDERSDVYALNVGLVYREVVQFHYCTDDACLGQQKIEEGIEMIMAIKEYGTH